MPTKYYHDIEHETVYSMVLPPQVREQKDRRGRRTGWSVTTTITITRADNASIPGTHQWRHPVRAYPLQQFDAHYTEEAVGEYFLMHHEPKCPEIDEITYRTLNAQYEARAQENK